MSETASTPAESGALGPDHGYGPDIDHVLLSEQQIQDKITELTTQVAQDYAGREVLLVGVLEGQRRGQRDGVRPAAAGHQHRPGRRRQPRADGGPQLGDSGMRTCHAGSGSALLRPGSPAGCPARAPPSGRAR